MYKPDSDGGCDMTQGKTILDPHGGPLPSSVTRKQHWNAISIRVRITLVSALAVIAATAVLLTNCRRYINCWRFRRESLLSSLRSQIAIRT